ncbi:MAG: penicillin-binding protein 2 [Candidatus Moranbacteria bacterium]|nr:penicillin-binding protein 2 [Candidatus Moranbacteria bacterium]
MFFQKKKIPKGGEIEDSIMTVTQGEDALIEKPIKRRGFNIFWSLVCLALLLIGGRVFWLDVIQGKYYQDLSKGNRIRSITIQAPRGEIFDRSGNILAVNIPSLDAVIVPARLPENAEERKNIIAQISAILDLEKGNVEVAVESQNRKSLEPVLLKENITHEQALILSEKSGELPGIELERTAVRNYEDSFIFSHTIGYDGKITREELKNNSDYRMTDYIGKTGVEKYYEKYLRGDNGQHLVEVDAAENVKKELGIVEPKAGSDIFLNLDAQLQKKLFDSISATLEKNGTKTAAAVAINPQNGEILALVSFPSYDNNLFAQGISNTEYQEIIGNKNLPLFNRVIGGEYPPGSTIKPLVASAALTEKIINPETTVNCSGGINIGDWHFGDWKTHGGGIDVRKAIAESCDVFFYSVGGGYGNISGLGMDRMKKYEDLFGLGQPTGIDLPGEANGNIPSEEWKQNKIGERWYVGDSYHSAIGQGFITATPIQLASYISAIANNGTLYSPKIVNKIKNNAEEKEISPEILRKNFISQDILRIVREGMRQTVTSGTAQSLNNLPVAVAGKTGTSQFGSENKTHGWFVSFAPYENPQIAMVVLMEGEGEGNSTAVPITKEVLDWYFRR